MINNKVEEKLISVDDVLRKMKLDIPNYQRPYKWSVKTVSDLLDDIDDAIKEGENNKDFRYRIGTIILHKDNNINNLVDGQQRIFTLSLILYCLDNYKSSLLNKTFSDKISQQNIHNNYMFIKNWFSFKNSNYKLKFKNAFKNILEVVLITVENLSTAFQLFDSQNTRGKSLDPHDLLKAYHLREIHNENEYSINKIVEKWESIEPKNIKVLFKDYLFPILNWTRKEKTTLFSSNNIDYYKGIKYSYEENYTYAIRASKSTPIYQINEPYISGKDFFDFVSHYIDLLETVKNEIETNPNLNMINEILNDENFNNSVGFQYVRVLFYAVLLCYYDRFHNFDRRVVYILFNWAFMLRVDMKVLGFDSINRYAIGECERSKYSNNIPMLYRIVTARRHTDISCIQINIAKNEENEKWEKLYNKLISLNKEDNNE